MKITARQTVTRKKVIEINTPYYFCLNWGDDVHDCLIYGRVDDRGCFTIKESYSHINEKLEWELCQGADLPEGWHIKKNKIKESEFLSKLDEFINILLEEKEKL